MPSEISPIAVPLADKGVTKKIYKLTKRASKNKGQVRRGVKEVTKALRKGETSSEVAKNRVCIIAGDISPIDVITHIPTFCEEKEVLYIYVESKEALGLASLSKRPTS